MNKWNNWRLKSIEIVGIMGDLRELGPVIPGISLQLKCKEMSQNVSKCHVLED